MIRCRQRQGVLGFEVDTPQGVEFFSVPDHGSMVGASHAAHQLARELAEALTPEQVEQLTPSEILAVVSGANVYQWKSHKGNFFAKQCESVTGSKTVWVTLAPHKPLQLKKALWLTSCRLVLIHAFLYRAEDLAAVCRAFPKVRFVVINHSSLPYSALSGRDHFEHILLSAEQENLIYALADDRIPREHEHMMWLANPVRDHSAFHAIAPDPPAVPSVHICGRNEATKNHFTAATAIALLQRKRPVSAVLNIRNRREDGIDLYLKNHGIPVEIYDWVDWEDFPQFILDHVELLIQPTLTESHNLVGIEHLLCGVPVLGSPAMRYLPRGWQRDPEDPVAIAECAEWVLRDLHDDPEWMRREAKRYGQKEAQRCNEAFTCAMKSLSETP